MGIPVLETEVEFGLSTYFLITGIETVKNE